MRLKYPVKLLNLFFPMCLILSCTAQMGSLKKMPTDVTLPNPNNPLAFSLTKLIAETDLTSSSLFGSSIAISADGATAVVGSKDDNSGVGAVAVYILQNGVWIRQGSKLVGGDVLGLAAQGSAVAISADGNTIAVGGNKDDKQGPTIIGAVWIYVRNNGQWTQQGSKLVGSGMTGIGQAFFGSALAISHDGNTLLVGAPGDNYWRGAAWLYTRNNDVWTQQGQKLAGTNNLQITRQGSAVAISADGNTASVGGYGDDNYNGATWIYVRQNGVWTQQGSKLIGTGGAMTGASAMIQQGYSVALSSGGDQLAITGVSDDGFKGAIWFFKRVNGTWTQQGSKLTASDASGTNVLFGESVALSADGQTVVVSSRNDNSGVGAFWIFKQDSAGTWSQFGEKKAAPTTAIGAANFGSAVSLNATASTLLVSGLGDNSNAGAVWFWPL